jgi:hypothetical protein
MHLNVHSKESCGRDLLNQREMSVAGEEWDTTNADEKLELLRKDVIDIAAAHNALSWEVRDLLRRVDKLARDLVALRRSRPKS